MKILITGGAGYLGARLSEFLAKQGNDIFVLDYSNPVGRPDWSALVNNIIIGDVRDDAVMSKISEIDLDVIIHTISLDHNECAKKDFKYVCSINVDPAWNLLRLFSDKGLKKFIYFSTQQVYGRTNFKDISEEIKPNPVNVYGLTHLMSEDICSYYNNSSTIKCINTRLSNSYGPPIFKENNCWWLVINDFCQSAYFNKNIKITSDGSPQRDFVNIKDLCKGIKILIDTPAENINYNTYNIGSGITTTILELALIVSKVYQDLFGTNLPVMFSNGKIVEKDEISSHVSKFLYHTERMKELGFSPEISMEEGIKEIFKYLEYTH